MKKFLVSILLVLALATMSFYGLFTGVLKYGGEKKETPVAAVDEFDIADFNSRMELLGGRSYVSEKEYLAEKAKALNVSESSFTPVKQLITVLDTLSKKPVPNAIVRLDGVPRLTDRDGQIVVTMYKEFAELYVEKSPYNPYIEIMDVTGGNKIVYLKQPSDDIEVYGAMFEYRNDFFNLIEQPCYINIEMTDCYSELILLSNVKKVDKSFILVNGQRRYFSLNNEFLSINLKEFNKNDKFSVQVIYEGVYSKIYDLNLFVVEPNKKEITVTGSEGNANISDSEAGDIGNVKLDPSKILNDYLFKWFNDGRQSFEIADGLKLKIGYYFDARKAIFEYSIGFSYEVNVYEQVTTIQKADEKIKQLENESKEKTDRKKELEKEIIDKSNQVEEYVRNKSDRIDVRDDYIKRKENEIADLENQLKDVSNNEDYKKLQADIKRENNNKTQNIKYHEKKLKETGDKINDLVKEKEQPTIDVNQLSKRIDQIPGLIKKVQNINDLFNRQTLKIGLEFEVIGIFKYSAITEELIEVKISAGVKVKFSYTYQTVIWVIPCYVKLEISAGLRVEIFLMSNELEKPKKFTDIFDYINFIFTFGLRLDLGIGVEGLASVAGFGEAEIEIKFRPGNIGDEKSVFTGELRFRIGIKMQLLFWEKEYSHRYDPIYFLGSEEESYSVSSLNLMPRAFMEDNSAAISENQVFDNIYQSSAPQIVKVGEKYLLVWLEDSPLRDAYNRTVLKYSVFENNVWSEPKPVCDDGKADFFPDILVENEKAYVTWQKSCRSFNENDDVENMLQAGEIYFAEFDNAAGSFNAERITDNDLMDAKPKFALKEKASDTLTIVWQRNAENDVFGTKGTKILYSEYNSGSWSGAQKLYKTSEVINSITPAVCSGRLTVAYIVDLDGDIFTADGKVNIVTSSNDKTELSEGMSSNVQFAVNNGKAALFYYDSGYIMQYDFIKSNVFIDDENIDMNFRIKNDGTKSLIFYEKINGDYKQAFCAIYDNGSWSIDIQLSNEDGIVNYTDGFIDSDGTVKYVYNTQNEEGATVLCMSEKKLINKILIKDAFSPEDIINGEQVKLYIEIENCGDFNINKLEFVCFGQSHIIELEQPLKVGESRYFDVLFDAYLEKGINPLITVNAYNNSDIISFDTYILKTVLTDIYIDSYIKIIDGKQRFFVDIVNRSDYSTNAVLSVYINGKLYQAKDLVVDAVSELQLEFYFDGIDINDFIAFNLVTEMDDKYECDNFSGLYSIQNEKQAPAKINPYYDILNNAKLLLIY